jgi:hypothetical protein
MAADDQGQGYIVVNDPINPNRMVRAKLLRYDTIRGQDYEFRLEDGIRIALNLQLDSISQPLDPQTGNPAVNPMTGEPVYHIRWGMRVNTIYSEDALNRVRGENK